MENRKFFSHAALNLLFWRTFLEFDNRIAYDAERKDWIKSIIIHDDDFEEININEKSYKEYLCEITLFW